jgi:hypothetical protein
VGHAFWITPLIFGGLFLFRSMASSRRRQGGPRGPARPFVGSPGPTARREGPGAVPPDHTGTAPGWFRDPFVRHEQRYWSGTAWTEHVTDGGAPSVDPPPPPRDAAGGGSTPGE